MYRKCRLCAVFVWAVFINSFSIAGSAVTLNGKKGDIAGTISGSYDDFAIQSEIKKGESNLPGDKDSGEKTLNVSCNNGNISIDFKTEM